MEVEAPSQQHVGQQSTSRRLRNPLLIVNFILMVIGTSCGPLFLRAYFLYGGNRKWLSSFLQTAGSPLLFVPLYFSFRHRRRDDGAGVVVVVDGPAEATMAASTTTKPPSAARFFVMSPQLLLASVAIGVLMGLDDLMYAYGLAYLPVSTSSILISTQLAFTAGFALLLVRQRFTAFSVNALVLLSVGAAMLGMNASGDRPEGVSRAQYGAGFAMTLGAAALFGLMLPVIELSQARHAKRAGAGPVNYALVMEMQLVIGLAATAFCIVGMMMNNDFHAIPREAREFGLGGQPGYYLLLVGSAVVFQFFFLGTIGAIYFGSALLAGVIMTVLIPVTEVLAVMLFHEPFSGSKGVALGLSLWGLVSYFYGEVQTAKANRQSGMAPGVERLDP